MVGLVLAIAFVGTIIWSVAQADDEPVLLEDEIADLADELGEESVTFEETGEPIEPPVSVVIPEDLQPDVPLDVGMYTLTVHDDGCGVIRTTLPDEPRNLTWVVKDQDGFQVLGRAADGEDRYRYFEPGTYTAVLEAYGRGYEEVSNTVTISC
jgi:hypothetical protein